MISFKNILAEKHITLSAFAMRMNMTVVDASRLVNGEKEITPDIAEKLKMVLGVDVAEDYKKPDLENIIQKSKEISSEEALEDVEEWLDEEDEE